jgi:hypothetical protein
VRTENRADALASNVQHLCHAEQLGQNRHPVTPFIAAPASRSDAPIHLAVSERAGATGFEMQESTDADLMRYWHNAPPRRGDVVTIPILWLTLILSLLIHLAALWEVLPKLPLLHGEEKEPPSIAEERLAVRLMPQVQQPSAPSAPPPPAQGTPAAPERSASPPPPKARAPKAPAAAPSSPPVVATAPPTSNRPALPPPTPDRSASAPAPPLPSIAPPTIGGDLASYIAARRAARGEPEAPIPSRSASPPVPTETEAERRDRIIAANLASINTPTFGNDPRKSGGIFTLRHMSDDDAEFTFYGWDKDISRRTYQKIEVRKGNNSDIRIAVVRRIIEVIRDIEKEDFNWSSQRLGRVVVLSARAVDNAGLEDFMMQEFFLATRP